jgi:PTH1 family peptidyl-tRNA hydrolase
MGDLHLVAGLGNPGLEYSNTRHNVGFMVLDCLAKRQQVTFSRSSSWKSQYAKWNDVILLKPWTFMNRSGDAIGPIALYYKILPEQILVVVDDAALPLGRLRLRQSGSDGGHNGLRSIIDHLGEDFPRLRIGIGPTTENGELVEHVLGSFLPSEQKTVEAAIERAAKAIEHVVQNGVASTMNIYNRAEYD